MNDIFIRIINRNDIVEGLLRAQVYIYGIDLVYLHIGFHNL